MLYGLDTRLQRGHKVDDIRLGPGRSYADFLASHLARDQVQHALAVIVGIFAGLKRRRQLGNEQLRHLQLLVADRRRFRQAGNLGYRAYLIRIEHRLDGEAVVQHPDRSEAALGTDRNFGDPDLARLAHRLHQQAVSSSAGLIGREIVCFLKINRIDLLQVHEIENCDRLGALFRQGIELVLVENYELSLLILIALADFLPGHLPVADRAFPHIGQGAAALLVNVAKRHVLVLRCREHFDRNMHESEADCAFPDSMHGITTSVMSVWLSMGGPELFTP
ncbi:hypothetical protein D3C75_275620 [compost metagenome]